MRLVTATLRIYGEAARDAGRAFLRSAWALIALLLAFPLLAGAALLVAPLGFVGGFVLALLQAAAAGTYLACLGDALSVRKSMGPDAVRANLGAHTWDILGVLFPIFLVELLLRILQAPWVVGLVFAVAVAIFLNPVPEMIGRARSGGLELLQDAGRFMMNNGPEWLVPQLVALGGLALLLPGDALALLGLFGPRFQFIEAGSLALQRGGGVAGWAQGFGLVALVHLAMLFRGALYQRLGSGGRRAREWAERFR